MSKSLTPTDDDDARDVVRFSREMSITRKEFLASLSPAIKPLDFQVSERTITIDDGERRVVIELSEQGERRIALLRLPVTHVGFSFHGYTTPEREQFMARFDRAFQRGGG